LVGGIFAKQFAQEVPEAIKKLKSNFDIITGKGQENKVKTLEENYSNMSKKA
jgi:UDP-N-acetylglucosamine:LPS N-acetylglucosamine transferase